MSEVWRDVRRARRVSAGRPVSEIDGGDVPTLVLGGVDIEQGKKFLIPSCSCSGLKLYPYALPYTIGSGE